MFDKIADAVEFHEHTGMSSLGVIHYFSTDPKGDLEVEDDSWVRAGDEAKRTRVKYRPFKSPAAILVQSWFLRVEATSK